MWCIKLLNVSIVFWTHDPKDNQQPSHHDTTPAPCYSLCVTYSFKPLQYSILKFNLKSEDLKFLIPYSTHPSLVAKLTPTLFLVPVPALLDSLSHHATLHHLLSPLPNSLNHCGALHIPLSPFPDSFNHPTAPRDPFSASQSGCFHLSQLTDHRLSISHHGLFLHDSYLFLRFFFFFLLF